MAGCVADKSWLLIMVLQIDSENSATGDTCNKLYKLYISKSLSDFRLAKSVM